MIRGSGMGGRVGRSLLVGAAIVTLASVLLGARSPSGAFVLLAGLAVLFAVSRQAFIVGAAFAVPVSTVGWDVVVMTVDGRTLDARLIVTFGVTALAAGGVLVERVRPNRLEMLVAAFGALVVAVGLLRSDSVLTWAPPAARWIGYTAIFVLARACLTSIRELRLLAATAAAGFAVPAVAGAVQFLAGESFVFNGAVRATAPGGRGPLALAFASQMLLVLAYVLVQLRTRGRPAALGGFVSGVTGLLASATRSITLTAVLAIGSVEALRGRPKALLVVPLLFAIALAARPDLADRYLGTVREEPSAVVTAPTPYWFGACGASAVEHVNGNSEHIIRDCWTWQGRNGRFDARASWSMIEVENVPDHNQIDVYFKVQDPSGDEYKIHVLEDEGGNPRVYAAKKINGVAYGLGNSVPFNEHNDHLAISFHSGAWDGVCLRTDNDGRPGQAGDDDTSIACENRDAAFNQADVSLVFGAGVFSGNANGQRAIFDNLMLPEGDVDNLLLPEGDEASAGIDASTQARRLIWRVILDEWEERPVLGIGPGMTAPTVAAKLPAERVAPHNDYIGVLAEVGVVGLVLFLAVQGAVIVALALRVSRRRAGRPDPLVVAILVLFVAVNVLGAINNAMYFYDVQVPLWALVGAVMSVAGSRHPDI